MVDIYSVSYTHLDVYKRQPPYKRIKRVYTTDEPMEKTSTQKVKRFVETQKIIDEEKAEKLRREEAKSEEA